MRDVEKIRDGKATINLNNTDSWPVFRIPNEQKHQKTSEKCTETTGQSRQFELG